MKREIVGAVDRLAALVSLNGGRAAGMTSLAALTKRNKARCLVRVWCADHPQTLIAAVMTTDAGPLLVMGNAGGPEPHARRVSRVESWVPAPTLLERDPVPGIFCPRCRRARPEMTNLRSLVADARRTRRVEVSI